MWDSLGTTLREYPIARSECRGGERLVWSRRWQFGVGVLRFGVAALITTLLTACVGRSASDVDTPEPTASVPDVVRPDDSLSGAELGASDAYRAMWRDMAAAAETTDPGHEKLDDHASGAALRLLQHMMETGRKQDEVAQGEPRPSPHALARAAAKVELRDCLDSTHWVSYPKGGVRVLL